MRYVGTSVYVVMVTEGCTVRYVGTSVYVVMVTEGCTVRYVGTSVYVVMVTEGCTVRYVGSMISMLMMVNSLCFLRCINTFTSICHPQPVTTYRNSIFQGTECKKRSATTISNSISVQWKGSHFRLLS